jgi:hypothetical protein
MRKKNGPLTEAAEMHCTATLCTLVILRFLSTSRPQLHSSNNLKKTHTPPYPKLQNLTNNNQYVRRT